MRVTSQAESEPAISREISLQDNQESGTAVRFGDLQLVPVGDGLIHVRPFYVERQQQGSIPVVTEYRFVITSYNENATYAPTLGEALAQLFPGFDAELGDRVVVADEDPAPPEPGEEDEPAEPGPATDADAAELLAQAETLFIEAEAELRSTGDLGRYQEMINEGRDLVEQALDLIEANGG